MGNSRFNSVSYASVASARSYNLDGSMKAPDMVFGDRHKALDKKYEPINIGFRESVDSGANPESRAICIGLDVTGSMGMIPNEMAAHQLGTLMTGLIDSKVVTDPHLLFFAVGDLSCDRYPLQATQFEADERIADQLTELTIEKGGGGNQYESYNAPWLFAARKTKIDCFEKRGKKGFLFTIGDERVPANLTQDQCARILGQASAGISNQELYHEVREKWEVFHIIIAEGSHMRHDAPETIRGWKEFLDNRALVLDDYTKVAELILTAIAVAEGKDAEDIIESFQDAKTRATVRKALFGSVQ